MVPGFEVFEEAQCVSRPELDAENRWHRVAGTVPQKKHPVSACIALPRSFRRCVRPAWRTWWLLCTLCNHSHCCTQLQSLASGVSEARGAGGAQQCPPEANCSAEAPQHVAIRTPRLWQAVSCSLPPVSASCPRCLHLSNKSWFCKDYSLIHGVVAVYFNGGLSAKKRCSASAPLLMVQSGCYHLDPLSK